MAVRAHGTSRFVAAFVAGQRAAERSLCRACSSREGRSGPLKPGLDSCFHEGADARVQGGPRLVRRRQL